ncbi:hypothetical protein [Streptomyces sp. NPDC020489]|uniref:hypothetical protein n=1 Tax=Streptomyces sp. NPDC020489 TaxID=3365077 RepID=UPI0037AF723C
MPHDLATAQAELVEAKAALETLTERVANGDEDVTPAQLQAQKELISFAELRVEAAQRTAARMREDERVSLANAAKTAATGLINGTGMDDIADALGTAVTALSALAGLVEARNAELDEVAVSLADLDDDLKVSQAADVWASRRYGIWGDRTRVNVDGVGKADRLDLGDLTVAVVLAALTGTANGREAITRHRQRVAGLPNLAVRKLVDDIPEFAAELRVSSQQFAAADARGKADISEQGRRPLPEAAGVEPERRDG